MTFEPFPETTNDVDDRFGMYAGWAIACTLAAVLVVFDVHTRIRPPLVLAALIVGPGWALCCFLHIREKGLLWAVAISAGLATNVALGLAMIATNTWHPVGASILLLLVSASVLGWRCLAIASLRVDPLPGRGHVARRGIGDAAAFLAGLAIACTLAAVLVVFDVHTRIRPPLVLAALIVGPGWALCCFLHIREKGLLWAVAISAGLATNVALGLAMIATNTWHPVGASILLLLVSAVVLASRSTQIALALPAKDEA